VGGPGLAFETWVSLSNRPEHPLNIGPLSLGREQVLARLWEIANLSPEMTRNSVSAQIKALSMIVAIEGLIPDRRAVSAPPPVNPQIDTAARLREQQGKTTGPQPGPDLVRDEDGRGVPDSPPGAAYPRHHWTGAPSFALFAKGGVVRSHPSSPYAFCVIEEPLNSTYGGNHSLV